MPAIFDHFEVDTSEIKSQNMDSSLSLNEKSAFEELKNDIIEEFGPNAAEDERIIRFLRARDFDVKQAKIMLKKNLLWRKENKVDRILQDFKVSEIYEKYATFNMIGFDKEDSPILVLNLGKVDIKGLMKSIPRQDWFKFIIYFLEHCEEKMKERSIMLGGKLIDKWIVILDMKDGTLAQTSSKRILEFYVEAFLLYDAHYPERLKTAYFINVSIYFYLVHNVVRPFISKSTLQKVKIFAKDGWKGELLNIIDPSVLPAYLGGERTDPDGNPLCKSIVCHGGAVSEKYYLNKVEKRCLRKQPGVKSHVLKRRKTLDLTLFVPEAGSFIEWDIESNDYDIAFGLFYQEEGSFDINQRQPLIPVQRVNAHVLCETGAYKCEKSGIYVLTLDNSYSILRPKTLYYKVLVVKPNEAKIENNN